MRYLLSLVVVLSLTAVGLGQTVAEKLQEVSVGIRASNAQGSGTVVNRTLKDGNQVTIIVTAAHVVSGLKKKVGEEVAFDDAQVVQQLTENGRKVGELLLDSKVIRWSDPDTEDDIAILLLRKNNFFPKSADFFLEDRILPVGSEVILCGSPAGVDLGYNTITVGVISTTGRVLANGKVFDQTDSGSTNGSSGCGIYEKSTGLYLGQLQRGIGNLDMMGYYAPIRRMKEWGKDNKMLWVFDPGAEDLPTLEELKKVSVLSEKNKKEEKNSVPISISSEKKSKMEVEIIPYLP